MKYFGFLLALVAAGCSATPWIPARSASSGYSLENSLVTITLDRHTGGITAIVNRATGDRYQIDDAGFKLQAGAGLTTGTLGFFGPAQCKLKHSSFAPDEASYVFVKGPLTITLTYRLDPADAFAVKRIRAEFTGAGTFNIRRCEMFDWNLTPRPFRAIPYYGFTGVFDGMSGNAYMSLKKAGDGEETPPSDNSTAFYFRYGEGGIFSTLTCDYVAMRENPATHRYQSVYWPCRIFSAGRPFKSEGGIVGVYRRKGFVYPPYQPKADLFFFHYPEVDVRLDRGEIEAMKAAVQKFTAPGVYCAMVNGWCLGLPGIVENQEMVDRYAHAFDTVKKIPHMEFIGQPNPFCGMSRDFARLGLNMPIKPSPLQERVFDGARSKGLGLSMLINVSIPQDNPQWTDLYALDAEGKRKTYNIALSGQYADFIFKAISELKRRYPIRAMTYDGLILETDNDTSHGYLPGRASLYPQWANLRDVTARVRKEFPDLVIRGQGGHTALGPWVSSGLSVVHNAHDQMAGSHRNFLDFHISHQLSNNMRASDWFTSQCKMFPRYMMNSEIMQSGFQIHAWDYLGWEFGVLSQLASSDNFGEIDNVPDEQHGEVFLPQQSAFLDKWITWHRAHRDYYRLSRELFGEPRPTGVDGYAYGNGRDAIVFLRNPTYRTHPVAVPVGEEIFLPRGGRYSIRELYPQERFRIGLQDGVSAGGSPFVTDVPPQSVIVLEIKPDDPEQPLLLGIEGSLQATADGWALSGVAGPPGTERLIAVRLPRGYRGPEKVSLNGSPLPTNRDGGLLVGRIGFGGEPIEPEVKEWHAEQRDGHLVIRASIPAPESAQAILASQRYPVAAPYNNEKWFNQIAWLGSHRFIIYLPILPPDVKADQLTGEAIKKLEAGFTPMAWLNDKPIAIHSNLLSEQGQRWAGFFIDASDSIHYGAVNDLRLEFPKMTSEDRFYGIYLPNLTRQRTSNLRPLTAPSRIETRDVSDAADAFFPVPCVESRSPAQILNLRLTIIAKKDSLLVSPLVKVDNGELTSVHAEKIDPRWLMDSIYRGQGAILLGAEPRQLDLTISGKEDTKVSLGPGEKGCEFTLGQVLAAWRARNDRFDPNSITLNWPARQAAVAIELVAPTEKKLAVRED